MQAKWYKCHGDSIRRFLARNIEFKFWSIFLYDCRQSGISQWTLHAKFKRWKNGEYDRHNLSTKIYTTLPANLYHFACVVRDNFIFFLLNILILQLLAILLINLLKHQHAEVDIA